MHHPQSAASSHGGARKEHMRQATVLFVLCLAVIPALGSRLRPKRFQPADLFDEPEITFDDPLMLQAKDIIKNHAVTPPQAQMLRV